MKTAFDVVHMRDLLLNEKSFLKQLYTLNTYQNKKLINGADNQSLNTLIKILHLILNNEIPILVEDVTILKKSKKFGLLQKKIKGSDKFIELLEGERKPKLDFLLSLANVYHFLLRSLFGGMKTSAGYWIFTLSDRKNGI